MSDFFLNNFRSKFAKVKKNLVKNEKIFLIFLIKARLHFSFYLKKNINFALRNLKTISTYHYMLKQPFFHDIRGILWQNASFIFARSL